MMSPSSESPCFESFAHPRPFSSAEVPSMYQGTKRKFSAVRDVTDMVAEPFSKLRVRSTSPTHPSIERVTHISYANARRSPSASFAPVTPAFTFACSPPSHQHQRQPQSRFLPLRLPTSLPIWRPAYLVPTEPLEPFPSPQDISDRIASALLDDVSIRVGIQLSPSSSRDIASPSPPTVPYYDHAEPSLMTTTRSYERVQELFGFASSPGTSPHMHPQGGMAALFDSPSSVTVDRSSPAVVEDEGAPEWGESPSFFDRLSGVVEGFDRVQFGPPRSDDSRDFYNDEDGEDASYYQRSRSSLPSPPSLIPMFLERGITPPINLIPSDVDAWVWSSGSTDSDSNPDDWTSSYVVQMDDDTSVYESAVEPFTTTASPDLELLWGADYCTITHRDTADSDASPISGSGSSEHSPWTVLQSHDVQGHDWLVNTPPPMPESALPDSGSVANDPESDEGSSFEDVALFSPAFVQDFGALGLDVSGVARMGDELEELSLSP